MEVAGDPKEGCGENGDGDGDHRRIGWSQRVEVVRRVADGCLTQPPGDGG